MESPMPIQQQALPLLLRGFDLVGIAKTGSGKTLAFLLPGVVHIEAQEPLDGAVASPIALVLAPVRELAVQIAEEANKLLAKSSASARHPKGLGAVALYGGGARVRWDQLAELQKGWCQIVTATPGRACDFLQSGDLSLGRVTYFVLDEADRMLECGFEEQMGQIAGSIRSDRQTLFFSATWPAVVQKLASRMCHSPPVRVTVGQKQDGDGPTARGDIVQEIVVLDGMEWEEVDAKKQEIMYSHIRTLLQDPVHKVLVFVNTKNMSWEVAGKLTEEGFSAEFMYGGRSQDVRADIVRKFKEGEIKLLVTTDVMARGLDIPHDISHVVVFDCYGGIEEYVHRIGRTARGPYGRGHALTFFEYDPKYSGMASELLEVLQQAGQPVPPELQRIADEVASGERKVVRKKW
ncbi:unnamed protein product [Prorocentrum cordatum]|uniref:RNA helicase n=1 Tax=Prorocentrum cordatum TaxID=2364126 RepID=A0ABN9QHG1_9DINO|nr:unnamed protein product [Polarella glacialis]